MCSLILGGGRETKESEIDLSVGLVLHKKVGDQVIKRGIIGDNSLVISVEKIRNCKRKIPECLYIQLPLLGRKS